MHWLNQWWNKVRIWLLVGTNKEWPKSANCAERKEGQQLSKITLKPTIWKVSLSLVATVARSLGQEFLWGNTNAKTFWVPSSSFYIYFVGRGIHWGTTQLHNTETEIFYRISINMSNQGKFCPKEVAIFSFLLFVYEKVLNMGGWGGTESNGYFGRNFFRAFLKCKKITFFQK